jgi:hypothetical protein
VAFESAADAFKAYPDLWPTTGAARKAFFDERERAGHSVTNAYKDTSISKSNAVLLADYQFAGERQRRKRAIITACTAAEARARIEALIGPVVAFEVLTPDAAPGNTAEPKAAAAAPMLAAMRAMMADLYGMSGDGGDAHGTIDFQFLQGDGIGRHSSSELRNLAVWLMRSQIDVLAGSRISTPSDGPLDGAPAPPAGWRRQKDYRVRDDSCAVTEETFVHADGPAVLGRITASRPPAADAPPLAALLSRWCRPPQASPPCPPPG